MALTDQLISLSQRIAAECKSIRTLLNGNASDLSALNTTAKGNLVAAINEVRGMAGGGVAINDTTPSATTVYSSSKTNSAISTAVSNLVNSSPTTLDTLKELADAIGDDPNYAATTATALGNRVRVDAAQTFTSAQQTQGQSNLGVYSTAQVGDVTTNFVTTFVNALS